MLEEIFSVTRQQKMASLLRLGLRQGCRSFQRYTPVTQQVCSLKTSSKKKGSIGETNQDSGDQAYHSVFHPDAKKHGVDDRMENDDVCHVFIFGSFGLSTKEPYTIMLCPSSSLASSSSVHTSPWDMVTHRNFILGTHVHICPPYMHIKYLMILTCSF